jgi:hypothetical protein
VAEASKEELDECLSFCLMRLEAQAAAEQGTDTDTAAVTLPLPVALSPPPPAAPAAREEKTERVRRPGVLAQRVCEAVNPARNPKLSLDHTRCGPSTQTTAA